MQILKENWEKNLTEKWDPFKDDVNQALILNRWKSINANRKSINESNRNERRFVVYATEKKGLKNQRLLMARTAVKLALFLER